MSKKKNMDFILLVLCYILACTLNFFQKGISLSFFLDCCFLIVLVWVSIWDIRTLTIPDSCHLIIAGLGIISCFLPGVSFFSHLLGAIIVSVPLLLIAIFTDGFGGADIKLCAACGLYLGSGSIVLGSFIGTIIAALYGILLLSLGKSSWKGTFCFGPFLSLGFVIALLYGSLILGSYLTLLS